MPSFAVLYADHSLRPTQHDKRTGKHRCHRSSPGQQFWKRLFTSATAELVGDRAMSTQAMPDHPFATDPAYSYTARQTPDADEHAACLTNWQQNYVQLTAGVFRGEFEEFCFDDVQLFREGLNQCVHQSGLAWAGSRTFGVPIAIEGGGWFGGEHYDASSLLTLANGQELNFRTPPRLEILACATNADALNRHAREVEHRDLEVELAGHSLVPCPPAAARAFTALLSTMFASLRATPEMLNHPQLRKALQQAIFNALLDIIPPAPGSAAPCAPPARQLLVKRARDYMEAHIDQPITIAELCIALGVSRRTLQYSFQEVLNLNPIKYLRTLRLNGVRRTLRHSSDTEGSLIADVAARWGFWHLSHFAAEYKALFGELPSETLRSQALSDQEKKI